MPSSHSSSSHSSFGGGSSFGSASFHSSPSSHSYSSHSSSWSSSSHLSRSESYPSSRSYGRTERYEPKPLTPREIHAGDSSTIVNILLLHYLFRNEEERRKKHYTYHPRAFTDKYGHDNKAGYYDEDTGRCYENMVMPGIRNIVTCPQCQAQHFHTWEYGSSDNAVTCPFCDHRFIVPDKADGEYVKEIEKLTPEARWKDFKAKAFDILPTVFGAVIAVILIIGFAVGSITLIEYLENRPVEATATRVVSGSLNTIYVEPIGRECTFDGENYYDKETDMYFWFNTDVSPAQWQYWYEPISGQYGDFGWMEYDDSEQRWYIEASSGTWVKYEGDTSAMWHFDNAYIGPETMVVVTADPDQEYITVSDSCHYTNMKPGTYIITITATDTDTNATVAVSEVTVKLENSEGDIDLEYEVPASVNKITVHYTWAKE